MFGVKHTPFCTNIKFIFLQNGVCFRPCFTPPPPPFSHLVTLPCYYFIKSYGVKIYLIKSQTCSGLCMQHSGIFFITQALKKRVEWTKFKRFASHWTQKGTSCVYMRFHNGAKYFTVHVNCFNIHCSCRYNSFLSCSNKTSVAILCTEWVCRRLSEFTKMGGNGEVEGM